VINVHTARVLDFDFHPFISTFIATASEDGTVKLTSFPSEGLTADIKDAQGTLSGHGKRVGRVQFNPVADNVLMSAGYDNTIKIWDIEAQSELFSYDGSTDLIQHVIWNRNGSILASTCKDKALRVYDPRSAAAVQSVEAHQGGKSMRAAFMENHNMIAVTGFSKTSVRKVNLYDPRKISTLMGELEIDQSAGVLISHYDEDTSLLFLGGKGDGNIRYFDVVDEAPYIHHVGDFRSSTPQKGLGFASKAACDYNRCEIALCLRVLRDVIEPIHFEVPRKTDIFQSDLYPDTYAGDSSGLAASAWAKGKNAEPVMKSIQEVAASSASSATITFAAKKSTAELEKELAEAHARIAELEAKLAKYKK